ncbi:MAG: hypothetical protein HUJ31_15480 [Pseudomonadales bacterium]|nr:hypothetical protein [Pseudomonadales bacterium]
MTKLIPLTILLAIFSLSACQADPDGQAQEDGNEAAEDGNETTVGERLLAVPPGDWNQIYQINNTDTRVTEFVPPEQTARQWDTKLAFESFTSLVDSDPIQVLLNEAENDVEKCSFVQHFNLFSGLENNYPVSFRLIMCGENEELKQGEVELLKAIKGNEYFYIIRLLKRVPPFEIHDPDFTKEEIADWATYFRLIGVCDPSREDHPCPS